MLTAAQEREFFEAGFVRVPDVFGPSEVARMRAAFSRLERAACRLGTSQTWRGSPFVLDARPDAPPRILRVVWCGASEPVLSEFGRDPRLVGMAARLLGSDEMHQLVNQAHFKLPGDGVEFPWHQDSTHRRYGRGEWTDANGRGSYVQTLTAIDDMTDENGPVEFLPGSCALGHLEALECSGGALPPGLDERSGVKATVAAGGVVLFGPYTIHRSLPNESDRPRRAFVNGFAYPGANSRVYPGEGAGRVVRAVGR
jgi:ectoine hydroxylase-related dioxygenase (phytanoyl-CoA dioxygenase family)